MTNIAPTVWNPFTPGYLEDPSAHLSDLRSKNPVHKGINGRWMLFKYKDVKHVLLDPAFKTIKLYQQIDSKNQFLNPPDNLDRLSTATTKWLFFIDAPEHPVVRQLVVKLWNQYDVQGFIEEVVDDEVGKIAAKGKVEIISDLAILVPIRIICKILGIPVEDHFKLRSWAFNFARTLELFESLDKLLLYDRSAKEFYDYMTVIVEAKKSVPDGSFISNFLIANESQDEPLSREHLVSVFIILFFAGIETSIYLIGQSVLHLIQNPAQTNLLRDHPSLTSQAVEELIRFSSPLQYTPRIATQDIELRGKTIRSGEIMMACVASANRDPEVFDKPEKIDFTRKSNPHLSFGHGLHHCIGARLARDEMKALLSALVSKFPKIEFDGPAPYQWDKIITNRGLKRLNVSVTE
jgi:pimeloyl-[acyl-carrier protein] synthase